MSHGLIITYFSLLVTAATGAFVFFGFSLFGSPKSRRQGSTMSFPRRTIPLNWVILHIFFAVVTLVLFTATVLHGTQARAVVDVSFVLYVVTFLTGALFFVRFDARHRPLRKRLLGLHLMMAIATFIMMTAVMGVTAFPDHVAPPPSNPKNSTLWDLARQHRSEIRHQELGISGIPHS